MPSYAFQWDAIEQVMTALQEHQSVLLQCPTGGGKTRMATEIARLCEPRVLFIAESREIIKQSISTFEGQYMDVDSLTADRVTGGAAFDGFSADFVIASQRTAWSRGVKRGHDLGDFRTIVIDEAHHIRARTYHELLKLWPDAKRVLLTATPVRGDGKGLGNVATCMVQGSDYGGNYSHLTDAGVLVPCPPDRVWSWPQSLSGVRTQAGDYAMGGEKGAAKVMDTPKLVGDIVAHWKDLAEGRPTIVYATTVAHAEHIEQAFLEAGVRAATVHAKTDKVERDRILTDLSDGEVEVVCNYGVLTEGFDCPSLSCIVLARPTKQQGLYLQMVGRGLRACEGKRDLMVLDHAGIVPMHGLPGTDIQWHLTEDGRASVSTGLKAVPCPKCRAILNSRGACGACGWKPEKRLRFKDGEQLAGGEHEDDGHEKKINLVRMSDQKAAEIKAEASSERKSEYWRLRKVASKRGLSDGWAAHKFKDRYGEWPPYIWQLPNPLKVQPAEFLEAAQRFAQSKGWKKGWASFQFKNVYGQWPPRDA